MSFLTYDDGSPKPWNIGCLVVGLLVAGPAACGLYSTFSSTTGAVTSAPGRVISSTLQTDNILGNYSLFFDRSAQYDARLAQIKEHKLYMVDTTDADEKIRLRTELSTMRASCRNLATSYNADSQKLNVRLFKSNNLPYTLSMENCDA